MTIPAGSVLFADSNVFIEALFIPESPAALVMRIIVSGAFELTTCSPAIKDVDNVISRKLDLQPDLRDAALKQWEKLRERTSLVVCSAPTLDMVRATYNDYISIMRHEADIEILAAALLTKPAAILSGNRKHFNDAVSAKCGIPIFSCSEFVTTLVDYTQAD